MCSVQLPCCRCSVFPAYAVTSRSVKLHLACPLPGICFSLPRVAIPLFLPPSLPRSLLLTHSLYLFIHLSLHLSLHHSGVLISCGCPVLHPLPKNSHGFSLTVSLTLAVFFSLSHSHFFPLFFPDFLETLYSPGDYFCQLYYKKEETRKK